MKKQLHLASTVLFIVCCVLLIMVGINGRGSFTVSTPQPNGTVSEEQLELDLRPTPEVKPQVPEQEPTKAPTALKVTGVLIGLLLVIFLLRAAYKKANTMWTNRALKETIDSHVESESLSENLVEILKPKVSRAFENALAELANNPHPQNAVIAAWLALEEAVQDAGLEPNPAATPTEFTLAALQEFDLDAQALETFLKIFHRARFTHHPVNAADIESAKTCLLTLQRDLDQGSIGTSSSGSSSHNQVVEAGDKP